MFMNHVQKFKCQPDRVKVKWLDLFISLLGTLRYIFGVTF